MWVSCERNVLLVSLPMRILGRGGDKKSTFAFLAEGPSFNSLYFHLKG